MSATTMPPPRQDKTHEPTDPHEHLFPGVMLRVKGLHSDWQARSPRRWNRRAPSRSSPCGARHSLTPTACRPCGACPTGRAGPGDQQLRGVGDLGQVGDRPVTGVGQQHPGPLYDPGGAKGHCGRVERRDQEPGQRGLVADPEPGDGHVVRRLVGRQDPEGDVLTAAAFDLAGGPHPDGVGVQQDAEQGLGS